MIRALCWKEFREHRLVWLLVGTLTVVLVVGLAAVLAPGGLGAPGQATSLRRGLLTLIEGLAVAYGLVCGALMLAGEREAGTLPFLDTLAGRRGPLWVAKALIGEAFSLSHGLALALFV